MTSNLKDQKDNNTLKAELSHLANTYYHNYQPSRGVLKKHGILKKLCTKDIIIMKPDKGNGVAIMDKKDYQLCMLEIIMDKSKFKKLATDPTLKREGQFQCFLLKLRKKGFFDKDTYDNN